MRNVAIGAAVVLALSAAVAVPLVLHQLEATLATLTTWADEATTLPVSASGDANETDWDALVQAVTDYPSQAQTVKDTHKEATAPPLHPHQHRPPRPAAARVVAAHQAADPAADGAPGWNGGATGPFWQWGPCSQAPF